MTYALILLCFNTFFPKVTKIKRFNTKLTRECNLSHLFKSLNTSQSNMFTEILLVKVNGDNSMAR